MHRAQIDAVAFVESLICMRSWLAGLVLSLPLLASASVRVEMQRSGVDARLRGVSAVNAKVAWASGSKGTVLRTIDGGAHWQHLVVPDADKLDFRDVEGFDADNAVIMAAGPGVMSRVFRTRDGGATWTQVLDTSNEKAFFDCMTFEGQRGWLLGDPIGDRYQLYTTRDGGWHWTLDDNGPPALKDEAAFAASGTCIARLKGAIAVVSGGMAARLHLLRDGQHDWRAMDTGMARGKPAAGAFSVAAWRGGAFVVGGEYTAEQAPGNAATLPSLAARAMHIDPAPRGYRSGAACTPRICIVVGPAGVDAWDGERWTMISDASFDAVSIRGNTAWLSGAKGGLGKITL